VGVFKSIIIWLYDHETYSDRPNGTDTKALRKSPLTTETLSPAWAFSFSYGNRVKSKLVFIFFLFLLKNFPFICTQSQNKCTAKVGHLKCWKVYKRCKLVNYNIMGWRSHCIVSTETKEMMQEETALFPWISVLNR